jgi:hypothetical protein
VRRFDSIALNYVVHCLPASWPDKGVVFEHLKTMLNPGGTLFGATLVQVGIVHLLVAGANLPAIINQRADFLI